MAWQREMAWRRLEEHGEERCVFACDDEQCVLEGVGAVAINGSGLIFEYRLECTTGWEIKRAGIIARLGTDEFHRVLERRDDGTWLVDGVHAAEYDRCEDLDLYFSPSTNTVTMRRLQLRVGEERQVRSLLVAEPELNLHPLDQVYRRADQRHYEYQAGDFRAVIEVDEDGVVLDYPGLFTASMVGEGAAMR